MPSSHPTPWDLTPPPPQTPHRDSEDEDAKAPYDDLIDQYATPFRQNPSHKAVTVDPSAFDQSKGALAYALSKKSTHTSDTHGKDLEGSSAAGHDWAYPPASAKEEKEESGQETTTWVAAVRRAWVSYPHWDMLTLFFLSHFSL